MTTQFNDCNEVLIFVAESIKEVLDNAKIQPHDVSATDLLEDVMVKLMSAVTPPQQDLASAGTRFDLVRLLTGPELRNWAIANSQSIDDECSSVLMVGVNNRRDYYELSVHPHRLMEYRGYISRRGPASPPHAALSVRDPKGQYKRIEIKDLNLKLADEVRGELISQIVTLCSRIDGGRASFEWRRFLQHHFGDAHATSAYSRNHNRTE